MKTTVDLPDDLMRSLKVRAAREDRSLKDLMTQLLRKGLAATPDQANEPHRVTFPLVICQPVPPDRITPEVVAEVLLDQEVDWATP